MPRSFGPTDTPANALKNARDNLACTVEIAKGAVAEALKELEHAERHLADVSAKLKAMDEFIAKTGVLANA